MEYRLVFATNNIFDSFDKLKKAIAIVTEKVEDDYKTEHINESILNKIIIRKSFNQGSDKIIIFII